MSSALRRLVIVSHVVHYEWSGRLYAYGPYAREIDIWADLFPEIIICAPRERSIPPGDCLAFTRENIVVAPVFNTGGHTIWAKATQIGLIPTLVWALARAMRRADAIHVRCPGNLGLLGCLIAPIFSTRIVAKYAGQWAGFPGEPWTYWLQRRILSSIWWRGPVTVYGNWPKQPRHVIPFFTSILDCAQMERARKASTRRRTLPPLQILYVGRLSPSKNVDILVHALDRLRAEGMDFSCSVIGTGPEQDRLVNLVNRLGLSDHVCFIGGVPHETVLDHYERGDVLVLASDTEGWPKTIAEGMAFGLICIGSDRGLIPQMLANGRGFVVPPRNVDALTNTLRAVLCAPERFEDMRRRAAEWAQSYSLESLRESLQELLSKHWGVALGGGPALPRYERGPA